MKRLWIFLTFLLLVSAAQASRVVEVEDYFSARVSEFIKQRHPHRPFTVFVKVETGEGRGNRDKALTSMQLPYLDVVEGEVDFWSRKDIPLTTLITYLDSVYVRVEIDADLSANEMNEFHRQLFENLKLSTASDKIEIKKMDWTTNNQAIEKRFWLYGAILLPVLLLLAFFAVTRLSVRALVKGLSAPISEIGKSTQNFAANAVALATGRSEPASKPADHASAAVRGDSFYEMRRAFKELVQEHQDLFANPIPEVIELLEKEGLHNPAAVGALLTELEQSHLKSLFKFGYGEWWFEALSSASGISGEAMELMRRLGFLKIRQQFSQTMRRPVDAEIKDLGLVLNRMSVAELESVAREYPLKKILPVYSLMAKEKCMKACKHIYPGEWGSMIGFDATALDLEFCKKIQTKALSIKPLRDDKTVENFFVTLDYQRYLDGAPTKDEKEFYKALPDASPVKKNRVPFFEFFLSSPDIMKDVVENIALQDWALALKDCERSESFKVFDILSEKQKYFLRTMIKQNVMTPLKEQEKIAAKKRIVQAYAAKIKMREVEAEAAANPEAA